MSLTQWILPIICSSGALFAQTLGDLNGLVQGASHYVSQGMAGTHNPRPLEMCKIVGQNGGQPEVLMSRSVDVIHWNFLYRIKDGALNAAEENDAAPKAPTPHRSVIIECNRGIFGGFKYSPTPIAGVKSLENTWIGVSLGDAIGQLNAAGYFRGFSKVTLMRPLNPALPDEYVYIFDCPWERTQVAISTQTGALSWRMTY